MGRRQLLHQLLKELPGVKKVYFQADENIKMEYPCIVYERSFVETQFASNQVYRKTKRYQVTIIDRSPDSEIPEAFEQMTMWSFDRHFVTDNLHHDIYQLYF